MTYACNPLPLNPYIQKVQTPPLYLLYTCLDGLACLAAGRQLTALTSLMLARSGSWCPHENTKVLCRKSRVGVIRTAIADYMQHTHKGVVSLMLGELALSGSRRRSVVLGPITKKFRQVSTPGGSAKHGPTGQLDLSRRQFRHITNEDHHGN